MKRVILRALHAVFALSQCSISTRDWNGWCLYKIGEKILIILDFENGFLPTNLPQCFICYFSFMKYFGFIILTRSVATSMIILWSSGKLSTWAVASKWLIWIPPKIFYLFSHFKIMVAPPRNTLIFFFLFCHWVISFIRCLAKLGISD